MTAVDIRVGDRDVFHPRLSCATGIGCVLPGGLWWDAKPHTLNWNRKQDKWWYTCDVCGATKPKYNVPPVLRSLLNALEQWPDVDTIIEAAAAQPARRRPTSPVGVPTPEATPAGMAAQGRLL